MIIKLSNIIRLYSRFNNYIKIKRKNIITLEILAIILILRNIIIIISIKNIFILFRTLSITSRR